MTSMLKPTLARANSVVMLRPDAPLLTAEVQRLAGEQNYQATKSALASLVKRGLIRAVRRGEKEAYVPNRSNPLYFTLLQSAVFDLPWAACLTAKGVDLAEVTAIYAYGSILQGSFGPGSDLDIVVAAPKRLEGKLATAFDPIERMIGRPVDVAVMSSSEIVERKTRGDTYIAKVLGGLRVYGEDLR